MDDGFTLIETLLALLISAVALAVCTHLLVLSVVAANAARDESVATWLAQAKFDRLRYDVTTVDGTDYVTADGRVDSTRGQFERTWAVLQRGATRVIRVEVRARSGRVVVHLSGAVLVTP